MSEEENKLIRAEFRRMLDKLIDSKIRPTATEIISVEQPLISLFEEVMYKLEKQQKEIKKEKNRIMELAKLLDKQENEIKFLKGELEIQEGCYISKDKIREKISNIRKKVLERYDSKLSVDKRIYKRNIQVAMLDTLSRELLEEK